MEDQSPIPNSEANDRSDQGSDQAGSSAVRQDEVPGSQGLFGHYVSTAPLEDESKYAVYGSFLNTMYDNAVRQFNNEPISDHGQTSFARAFWNGYGAAAAILRDTIRSYPIDPKVQ